MSLRPFHLAFPVHDLAAARSFFDEQQKAMKRLVADLGIQAQ